MRVYRLTIEYHGATFSGWQTQPGQRTVQGVIEAALAVILRRQIRIQGAGRTDAGVHALGQVASFETDVVIDPGRLAKGLTALSRPAIAVIGAAVAPDGFNARFDAVGKHYRYTILNRFAPSPLMRDRAFHVPKPLDLDEMRQAATLLIGEHDFDGFRASDCGRVHTVRYMSDIALSERGPMLEIDVKGTGFLKNMVRIIAGTLVDVGKGRLTVADVERARDEKDRNQAGETAPAHALTLVEVFYPEGWRRDRDRPKPLLSEASPGWNDDPPARR